MISTLKGANCPQPQPDYRLVGEMLSSIEPNRPLPTLSISDQVVADVDTPSVVVAELVLPSGGFVSIHAAPIQSDDPSSSVGGVSSKLSPGEHEIVRITLEEKVSASRDDVAMLHADTDGDYVFEFDSSDDPEDVPYLDAQSEPVIDRAVVCVEGNETVEPTTTSQPGFGFGVAITGLGA